MKRFMFLFLVLITLGDFCFAEVKKPEQKISFFFGTNLGFQRFGKEDINLNWLTKTGLGYSLNGGFIDTTHMGETCLLTRYYQQEIHKKLLKEERKINLSSEKPEIEFHIFVAYPSDYAAEDLKQFSIELAQYLSYNWAIIHEMMGWYGYNTKFLSEFESAFSPEDLYSDLLGTIIASEALKDKEDFDSACLRIMKEKLDELEIQNSSVVEDALKKTKGDWYNGKGWPRNNVWKRNWDIGIDDGYVTPCLVEGFEGKPFLLPVPKIPKNSFSVKIAIEIKEKQKKIISEILDGKRLIDPEKDFAKILEAIKKDAEKKLKN